MMTRLMKNLRKATFGDVHCVDCAFYHRADELTRVGRCGSSRSESRAVGKHLTCDAAEPVVAADAQDAAAKLLDKSAMKVRYA